MEVSIFDQVHDIMTGRRQKAVAENEARIREVNAKLPQIKEVNEVIYNTGKKLINAISSGKLSQEQINEKIQSLRKYNIGAQEMSRKILTDNGYPADYLDLHYICPKCKDTGYCGNQFCDCFKKLYAKLSTDKLNQSANIKLSSFDTFSLSYYKGDDYQTMKRILDFTRNYAENFTPSSGSILMFGGTGLGKTHLSLAIANKVLEKGYSVVYDSIINILRTIEKEHFSRDHSSEMTDLILSSELLIIDDLGTEYETQFYNSTVYNIINSRINSSRPTIINTNLDYAGINKRYEARVVSRLTTIYSCLEFKGEDIRMQKRLAQI